jgi:hypothetical protein
MIPEKTIRSLRRMRRRFATYRRKRVETMRNNTGRAVPTSQPTERPLRHEVAVVHNDGRRRPTRQELRVEAELRYATHELGLL